MSRDITIQCPSSNPQDTKFITESGKEITGIISATVHLDINDVNRVYLDCRLDKTNILAVLDKVVLRDDAGNFIVEANIDDYVPLDHYETYPIGIYELKKNNPVFLQGKHYFVERVIKYTYNDDYDGLKKFADIKLEGYDDYIPWYNPTITLVIPENTCV
jgi:hypothetical protein